MSQWARLFSQELSGEVNGFGIFMELFVSIHLVYRTHVLFMHFSYGAVIHELFYSHTRCPIENSGSNNFPFFSN